MDRETKEVPPDVDDIQLARSSSKKTSVSEATIVASHMISHAAFYEIHVRGFNKEKWTILRRFHWIKMVHDMLVSKGETVKHGQAFFMTTAASHIFSLPNFSNDHTLTHEEDKEPTKNKYEHIKQFVEELAFSNFQYEFVHKFFAPIRHLTTMTVSVSRTLITKTETVPFLDPIKQGEVYQPILSSDESDPEYHDLCSFDETNLKPFKTIEDELVALRTAVVNIRSQKQRIAEVDTMLLQAFSYRLREVQKLKTASVPVEKIAETVKKANSKALEKRKAEIIQEAKDS